jgi:hypothetical protein
MFICKKCLEHKFTNQSTTFQSYGKCEICEQLAGCSDIPSRYLIEKEKTMKMKIEFNGNNAINIMLLIGKQLNYSKPPPQAEYDRDLSNVDYRLNIPTNRGTVTVFRGDTIFFADDVPVKVCKKLGEIR